MLIGPPVLRSLRRHPGIVAIMLDRYSPIRNLHSVSRPIIDPIRIYSLVLVVETKIQCYSLAFTNHLISPCLTLFSLPNQTTRHILITLHFIHLFIFIISGSRPLSLWASPLISTRSKSFLFNFYEASPVCFLVSRQPHLDHNPSFLIL